MSETRDHPRVSIIVAAYGKRTHDLEALLSSILNQDAPPSYEVIVVAFTGKAGIDRLLRGWDTRFRSLDGSAFQEGEAQGGSSSFWMAKAGAHARGEFVLFLHEQCRLDDVHFIKKHVEAHLCAPEATAVGGRYRLAPSARPWEQAAHWFFDHRLSRARIDFRRTHRLAGGNASFKAARLKMMLFPDERVPGALRSADIDINLCALNEESTELHLIEALTTERRWRPWPSRFLKESYQRGFQAALRRQRGLESKWIYPPSRISLLDNTSQAGGQVTWLLRFLAWLDGFGFEAGQFDFSALTEPTARAASGLSGTPGPSRALGTFMAKLPRQSSAFSHVARRRLKHLWRSRLATELYRVMKYNVFRS